MDKYDYVIFDFDDTIWSRNPDDLKCSVYNAKFIEKNLNDKAIIISGNSFSSISNKLAEIKVNFRELWADANSTLYKYGYPLKYIDECRITDSDFIIKYVRNLGYEPILIGDSERIFNIKIRPIKSDRERSELVDSLNRVFEIEGIKDCEAKITGKTTVDILSVYNSKVLVYNYIELNRYKTLYIGDEIDRGNDRDIANLCTRKISVRDVYDTKVLLDCFGGKL